MAPRETWLDVCKGIAIVLVVIGHAIGGVMDANRSSTNGAMVDVFLVIYFFHMPLFMMLSGLTVAGRIDKGGAGFLGSTAKHIVWPYLLWSSIQILVTAGAGSLVNAPVTNPVASILGLAVGPPGQFWFLHALFCLHLTAFCLVRTGGLAFAFLGLLAITALPLAFDLPAVFRMYAMSALWYALGLVTGLRKCTHVLARMPTGTALYAWPAVAAMALGFAFVHAGATFPDTLHTGSAAAVARVAWGSYAFPAALAASLAVIGLSYALDGRLAKVLAFAGQASMAIFILHVMFGAGTRIVLLKAWPTMTPGLLVACITLVGIAGPLVTLYLAHRTGAARWVGLGPWPARAT